MVFNLFVVPYLSKLEVTDTEGYFVMNKSSINANYSKASHYPMFLSTLHKVAPNLQELICDCIKVALK